jgi:hypothetical protein
VSYDALTAEPEAVLGLLRKWLDQQGFPVGALDTAQLAVSHAPPASGPRPTIATHGPSGAELRSISSFDPEQWSGDIQQTVWPVVEGVHRDLAARFPTAYVWPLPPAELATARETDDPTASDAELAW